MAWLVYKCDLESGMDIPVRVAGHPGATGELVRDAAGNWLIVAYDARGRWLASTVESTPGVLLVLNTPGHAIEMTPGEAQRRPVVPAELVAVAV